jgi:phosphoglucomutase
VIAENGWFAARPSGTENIYKIYAESFRSEHHLRQIQQEAQDTITRVFEKAKAWLPMSVEILGYRCTLY